MYYGPVERVDDYLIARRTLTTFAVLTILLLIVTSTYAIICTLNFNKGLQPHLESTTPGRKRANTAEMDKFYNHGAAETNVGPARMTIE